MVDPLLKLVPTMQSLALLGYVGKKLKKKKIDTEDMLELGVGTIIGATLVKETADLIGE